MVDGVDIAQFYTEVSTTNLNAFEHVASSGLDMTIDGGEAFIFGWLCRDTQTVVTLPSSSSITVCVGFNPDAILSSTQTPADNQNIILDVESAFTNGAPKLPLYDVETTATSINTVTDVRPIGRGEADGPWLSEDTTINSVEGQFTISSTEYQDHLLIERSGVGSWSLSPTTGHGEALEIYNISGGARATFNLTADGHYHIEDPVSRWAVESPNQISIYTSSTDPTGTHSVSEGDIWIQTD